MKYFLIIIQLLFSLSLYAPVNKTSVCLLQIDPIDAYEHIIKAVVQTESSGDINAYNAKENAVGAFQIRQIRIDDFNNRTGKNYSLNDMYDYNKSREVFAYFACQIGFDYERIVKRWNGSGAKTEIYWNKVKKLL